MTITEYRAPCATECPPNGIINGGDAEMMEIDPFLQEQAEETLPQVEEGHDSEVLLGRVLAGICRCF